MNWKTLCSLASVLFLSAQAQGTLLEKHFDVTLEGDDPSESFKFDFSPNANKGIQVEFNGVVHNLSTEDTGVRYQFWWIAKPGADAAGAFDSGFLPLAGSASLPVAYSNSIDFTPSSFFAILEGGGPSDHFQVVGDLKITQVPERASVSLVVVGGGAVMLWRSRRRHGETKEWPSSPSAGLQRNKPQAIAPRGLETARARMRDWQERFER